jgi:hypothetical protein
LKAPVGFRYILVRHDKEKQKLWSLTFATPGAKHNGQNNHNQKTDENNDQVHFWAYIVRRRRREKKKGFSLTFVFGESAFIARRGVTDRSSNQTVHP